MDILTYGISILISLILGLLGFFFAFRLFNWMMPNMDLANQLKAGNLAVAIFLAGLFIGLGFFSGAPSNESAWFGRTYGGSFLVLCCGNLHVCNTQISRRVWE